MIRSKIKRALRNNLVTPDGDKLVPYSVPESATADIMAHLDVEYKDPEERIVVREVEPIEVGRLRAEVYRLKNKVADLEKTDA